MSKNTNYISYIAAAAFTLLCGTGCLQEMPDPLIVEEAAVELVEEQSPQTKSSVSGSETAVNDINIILFDHATGMLDKALYFKPASSMALPLVKGKTYDVYAVANAGDLKSTILSGYGSENSLKGLPLTFTSFADVTASGIPMASKEAAVVTGGATSVPLTLEKLVGKYVVNIDRSALASGSTLTVKSMSIRQAALTLLPFASETDRKTANVSGGDYAVASDVTALNSDGTIDLYIPENRQGVLTTGNSDPWKKIPSDQALKNACTYLEMVCSYSKTDKKADNVTYRMYLGADATQDFNIVRNSVYTLTIKPTDAAIDQSSWKLDPGEVVTWTHELKITPESPTIKWSESQTFTATYWTYKYINGVLDAGSTQSVDVTSDVSWSSSNSAAVTMSGATASAVGAGSSTVKAEYTSASVSYEASTTITVVDLVEYRDEIELTAGSNVVNVGGTLQLTATKKTYIYTNNVKGAQDKSVDVTSNANTSWSSDAPSFATVSKGLVTGVAVGSVTVTASYPNAASGSMTLSVENPISYSYDMVIDPSSASKVCGETQSFTASYRKHTFNGPNETGVETLTSDVTITYESLDTQIATVSGNTATCLKPGTVTIRATGNGPGGERTVDATLTVGDELSSITLSASPATVGAGGGEVTVSCTATYASGATASVTPTVTSAGQNSKNSSFKGSYSGAKVTIPSLGSTEVAAGSYTVKASYTAGGVTKTAECTVDQSANSLSWPEPTVTLSYSPNPIDAAGGTASPTLSYTQTGTWSSGETKTVTTGETKIEYSGSATGFTLDASTGKVTAAANIGAARSITVTASVTVNGKTGTCSDVTVQQNAGEDYVVSYSELTIESFSYSSATIAAEGGNSSTPTITYKQKRTYASGKTDWINQGADISYAGSATGFTVNASTGVVTAAKNTDIDRSVDVMAIVSLNGETATKKTTVSQESKIIKIWGGHTGTQYAISASTPIPYPYSVTVTFEVYYEKFGGGKGVLSGSNFNRTILSNNTRPVSQFSTADIGTWPADAIVQNITGGMLLSVSPTTVGGYTINLASSDAIQSFDAPVITTDNKKHTVNKTMNSYNLTNLFNVAYSQTAHRYSGGTIEYTSGAKIEYHTSNLDCSLTTDGSFTPFTNYSGAERSFDITIVVVMNGKVSSKVITIYQAPY